MTAPLSRDLRERIARAVSDGSSIRQAADRFRVSPSAAIKLMQRVRQTGSTAPAKIGGYRRPVLEPYADVLRKMASEKKGITLREIQARLVGQNEPPSRIGLMWPAIASIGRCGSAIWIRPASCFWTRPPPQRR